MGVVAQEPASWFDLARHFTGESDQVRSRSIQKLRSLPELTAQLKQELTNPDAHPRTQFFLALDVISTLKMDNLLPDLLDLSASEPSGYIYHTINSLVTAQNRDSIANLYRERVVSYQSSPAAKMALLDSLARFGSPLPPTEIDGLLQSPHLELRSTALSYIRSFLLAGRQSDYLPLVLNLAHRGPFQPKVQALFLLKELSHSKLNLGDWKEVCRKDKNEKIRQLCPAAADKI